MPAGHPCMTRTLCSTLCREMQLPSILPHSHQHLGTLGALFFLLSYAICMSDTVCLTCFIAWKMEDI